MIVSSKRGVGVRTSISHQSRVRQYLIESAEVQRCVSEECTDSILAAADLIAETFRAGGKVLLCGNGGSAADCQHMATELVSCLSKDFKRPALPAIALTTDSSFLTAFSNDSGFEGVFERQVQALGQPGDVLIGISTSGNSVNVIRAIKAAQASKMQTITLTGNRGSLAEMTDVAVSVPSANTQYVQESHIAIEHLLCELVERDVFSNGQVSDYK